MNRRVKDSLECRPEVEVPNIDGVLLGAESDADGAELSVAREGK